MEYNLKFTPLIEEHKKLGAKIAPFGGWSMPIQYEGIIAEHNWTRKHASLFDICHMGEFLLAGDLERSGLDNVVTQKLDDMPIGGCRYGFMLNDSGGVIDDLIVYKLGSESWMLVVNAATTEKDLNHLTKHLSKESTIKNISEETAKLDLQGPLSEMVLEGLIGKSIAKLSYYTFSRFNILGEMNTISRTGYTGELGYELYISKDMAKNLWNTILKDERVRPAGLGARDTLRLEMAYPLYGQDIDENITPVEAALERFVDYDKDFIGKGALLKKKTGGPYKKMTAFAADSRRAPRHNYKILSGGKEIGFVTSGSFSPSLSCGIGMGYIEKSLAKSGSVITISGGGSEIEVKIIDKPFYKHGSARMEVMHGHSV
jgi:aminomethyltransferase